MLKSFRMFESQEQWDNKVVEMAERLKNNTNGKETDLGAFGAKIIYERLLKHPECYAEFGPYWFALKAALLEYGYFFGQTDDEEMRVEYSGKTTAHTIVVAEEFKEYYRAYYFQGNLTFIFEEDNMREWTLFDPEMASRV